MTKGHGKTHGGEHSEAPAHGVHFHDEHDEAAPRERPTDQGATATD